MLINLRNALMTGKRTPTAKDYVQDGLVAMWDGVEDEVNTFSLSYDTNNFGFDDFGLTNIVSGTKYISCDISQLLEVQSAFNSGEITAEYVARFNLAPTRSNFVRFESTEHGPQNLAIHSFDNSRLYVRDAVFSAVRILNKPVYTPKFKTTHCISKSDGKVRLGCNDSIVSYNISSAIDSASMAFDRGLHIALEAGNAVGCLRFYNRALTAEEIEHNYEIDKERFGLPDAS